MRPGLGLLVAMLALPACGDNYDTSVAPDGPTTLDRASDVPIDGLSMEDVAEFNRGDALFELPFRPADGLGPLFIRSSCSACHAEGSRGPGLVQKMVLVMPDGVTPAADQSALAFGHTIRQGMAAGATTPIVAPDRPDVLVSIRIGPPVLGRGYMEAVDASELARVAAEQAARGDGIHGVVPPDGRFGVKARVTTLELFTADAFHGDMGLTTPLFPDELPNPDGLTDDLRAGVDLDLEHVDSIAFYLRRIAIPRRAGATDEGAQLFDSVQCSACHVPAMHTSADYEVTQIADIDAPIFTDMLLHDMGPGLADGMTDGDAGPSSWRTAPLIGMRFQSSFLHDGRARDVAAAIAAHGGEAQASAAAFAALSDADQQTLLHYVEAL